MSANGSGCGMVKGSRIVPCAQLSVLSRPPTAATGLALTTELPKATAASIDVELVIMPHFRSTVALPPAAIPVVLVLIWACAQYSPAATAAAVAVTEMIGGLARNIELKLNFFWIDMATETLLFQVPALAG